MTAFAGTAAAFPAVDEYTLRPPSADGKESAGAAKPQGNPEELPVAVQKQLKRSEDGSALAAIATADELGAPTPANDAGQSSSERRSLPAAAASALTEPWSLAILVPLIALGAFAFSRRRRDEVG